MWEDLLAFLIAMILILLVFLPFVAHINFN